MKNTHSRSSASVWGPGSQGEWVDPQRSRQEGFLACLAQTTFPSKCDGQDRDLFRLLGVNPIGTSKAVKELSLLSSSPVCLQGSPCTDGPVTTRYSVPPSTDGQTSTGADGASLRTELDEPLLVLRKVRSRGRPLFRKLIL